MHFNESVGPRSHTQGIDYRGREVFGAIIRRQQHGGIAGSIVASGRTERTHWPIPPVCTGIKYGKFQGHGMQANHTQV